MTLASYTILQHPLRPAAGGLPSTGPPGRWAVIDRLARRFSIR